MGLFFPHHAILVPRSGVLPGPWAVTADSPNHWTTRELPPGVLYRLRYDGLGAKACVLPREKTCRSPAANPPGLPRACRPHRAQSARPSEHPALAQRASHMGLPAVPWTCQGHARLRSVCLLFSLLERSPPVSPWFVFYIQVSPEMSPPQKGHADEPNTVTLCHSPF